MFFKQRLKKTIKITTLNFELQLLIPYFQDFCFQEFCFYLLFTGKEKTSQTKKVSIHFYIQYIFKSDQSHIFNYLEL